MENSAFYKGNEVVGWVFDVEVVGHDAFSEVVESVGEVDLADYLLVEGFEHQVEFALVDQEVAVAHFKLPSVVRMV